MIHSHQPGSTKWRDKMKYYSNYESALKINLDKVESFFCMKQFVKANRNNKDEITILDIGCGIGYLTNYFSDMGKATGVDINEEALSIARNNFPNTTYLNFDIIKNSHCFNKFDFIICNNIIEHLVDEDRNKFLKAIKNNLIKDDGFIIFGYANPYHPVQLIWGFLTQKVLFDKTHIHNYTINQFVKIIRQEFKIIDIKKTSPFTKFIGLGKYFKGDIIVFSKK